MNSLYEVRKVLRLEYLTTVVNILIGLDTLEAIEAYPSSWYHRFIRSFFGFDMLYSVMTILLELQLPCFDNILLYNYKFSYGMQFACSGSAVVRYLVSIGML